MRPRRSESDMVQLIVTSTATDAVDATLTTRQPLPSRYRRSQQAARRIFQQPSTAMTAQSMEGEHHRSRAAVTTVISGRGDDTDRLCGHGRYMGTGGVLVVRSLSAMASDAPRLTTRSNLRKRGSTHVWVRLCGQWKIGYCTCGSGRRSAELG